MFFSYQHKYFLQSLAEFFQYLGLQQKKVAAYLQGKVNDLNELRY